MPTANVFRENVVMTEDASLSNDQYRHPNVMFGIILYTVLDIEKITLSVYTICTLVA